METTSLNVIPSDDKTPVVVSSDGVNAMETLKSASVVSEGDVVLLLFRSPSQSEELCSIRSSSSSTSTTSRMWRPPTSPRTTSPRLWKETKRIWISLTHSKMPRESCTPPTWQNSSEPPHISNANHSKRWSASRSPPWYSSRTHLKATTRPNRVWASPPTSPSRTRKDMPRSTDDHINI